MAGRSRKRLVAGWTALACVLLIASADAARTFPQNSRQVKITQVAGDGIVADGQALHLSPGVLIYTPNNTTLVRGAIPVDTIVRVQLDMNGDVRRIWLLADDEVLVHPWDKFWKRDQPQPEKEQLQVVPLETAK